MALVAAVLVAGCSGPSGSAVDGPVLRHRAPDPGGAGETAEVRGRVELEGECLYIVLGDVGERYPIVWPAGTTWDAGRRAVVGPSNERMPVGSEVYGGGGYYSLDDVERLLGTVAGSLAARCVDNEFGKIAIVNNDDEAIGPAE